MYIKRDAEKSGDPDSFAHVTSSNVLIQINPLLNKYGILLESRIISKEVREVHITTTLNQTDSVASAQQQHPEYRQTKETHTEVLYILDMQYKWIDVESKEELTAENTEVAEARRRTRQVIRRLRGLRR